MFNKNKKQKEISLVNLKYDDQIGNDSLNHRIGMEYTTNQHLSTLKKCKDFTC